MTPGPLRARVDCPPSRTSRVLHYLLLGGGMLIASMLSSLITRELFPKVEVQVEPFDSQDAAKALGFPVDFRGFTHIRDETGTVVHTSSCANCGYPTVSFAITYPQKPGPGWSSYDLARALPNTVREPVVGIPKTLLVKAGDERDKTGRYYEED